MLASQWGAKKHHRQRYSTTEIPALRQHQAEAGNQLQPHKREALARHRQRYRPTHLHSSHPSSPQRRGMNGARATTIACKRRYWHWWAGLSVATPQTLSFCGSSAPFDVTDDRGYVHRLGGIHHFHGKRSMMKKEAILHHPLARAEQSHEGPSQTHPVVDFP